MLKVGEVAAAEKGITLISGAAGLDKPIIRTHMVENLEIARMFIAEHEMIFTTGAGLGDEGELIQLLAAARDSGASGVVVNIGPYIHSVPPAVADYAENAALPLFSCPWEVRMAEIMHRISCRIDDSEQSTNAEAELFRNAALHPQEGRALRRLGYGEEARFRVAATAEPPQRYGNGVYTFSLAGESYTVTARGKDEIKKLLGDIPAAVSAECDISTLGRACGEAKRLLALFGGEGLRFFDESGIYRLLLRIEDSALLEDFCGAAIGPLLRYDSRRKTELLRVLETYIRCNSSLKEAASILGIHKNTVTNRLHKCEELLGVDISEPEQRLSVEVALAIRRMLSLGE